MKYLIFFMFACCLFSTAGYAQQPKCGAQLIKEAAIARNPDMANRFLSIKTSQMQQAAAYSQSKNNAALQKTTSIGTIPVIFHIVLDAAQLNQIGGAAGVAQRVDSQMAVINRDFNAQNGDSSLIPAAFKPLYGNVGISFGLAHRTPSGASTPGYEIITTTAVGFSDPNSSYSTAKHSSSNGADIWDPTSYLNVWVINPLGANGLLGVTVPSSFIYQAMAFPATEQGIVLNYGAFGVQVGSMYFINNITLGRTLTHELGHFFEIWHVWGDDNGACPPPGAGQDDGIADTPPQADATYGCPNFPTTDSCSKVSPGIMFMNYMDYTDDGCMHLFTKGQVNSMTPNVLLGGENYPLTTHPEILTYPASISSLELLYPLTITPNPSYGNINVYFTALPPSLKDIIVLNMLGEIVWQGNKSNFNDNNLNINLNGLSKGLYFVQCRLQEGNITRRIILQ